MSMTQGSLPARRGLQISALSRNFEKTTNSYKFFFFLALLDTLERSNKGEYLKNGTVLDGLDLLNRYLLRAWYPAVFFRLSLGSRDKLQQWIQKTSLQKDDVLRSTARFSIESTETTLGSTIKLSDIDKIFRFVPTRLIRPFFQQSSLIGIPDAEVDRKIRTLAAVNFTKENPPIYRWKEDSTFGKPTDRHDLIVHPAWKEYLLEHIEILRGWTNFQLSEYLQTRNPSSPSIVKKLFAPLERDSLRKQQQFWRAVINHQPGSVLKCPYSSTPLGPCDFSLDHYLPWSFVGHDEGWNLVPVHPAANSSKSDQIPEAETIRLMVKTHQAAFRHFTSTSSGRPPEIIQQMADFLEVPTRDLPHLPEDSIGRIYLRKIRPMVGLASNSGFPVDWSFGRWMARESTGSSWDHFEW
jgi:hypothetical protein